MKNPNPSEIARKALVLLLFVMFGFCMPGFAAPKKSVLAERSTS